MLQAATCGMRIVWLVRNLTWDIEMAVKNISLKYITTRYLKDSGNINNDVYKEVQKEFETWIRSGSIITGNRSTKKRKKLTLLMYVEMKKCNIINCGLM
ncbi:MAG: hypothetical protein WCF23_09690 [Candidatus Nitrosopolaris sp.]